MTTLFPWLRVLLAVAIYVVFALLASIGIRRVGADLKDMQGRTSMVVLAIGALANVAVLATVLLMLVLLDGRSLSSLGLDVTARDALVTAFAIGAIATLSAAFLSVVARRTQHRVRLLRITPSATAMLGAVMMLGVLFVVALQEEVVYRGYVAVNLLDEGWLVVALASIVSFTAIHLLTNRTSPAQVASWLLGASVLVCAYLVSGSIWVAVTLHFATDVTNVVALGIAGQYSLVEIAPPLSDRDRVMYRGAFAVSLIAILIGAFGTNVRIG
ncbi:MAG: CPBP family intramembrane glutamic endopeptidase [Dehalococcoidia bacterium]